MSCMLDIGFGVAFIKLGILLAQFGQVRFRRRQGLRTFDESRRQVAG